MSGGLYNGVSLNQNQAIRTASPTKGKYYEARMKSSKRPKLRKKPAAKSRLKERKIEFQEI